MANILIVDDEEDIPLLLKMDFESAGYKVHTALNYDQAIEFIESKSFEVIISDYKMPGKTGLELYDKVRELELSNKPDFILMTGHSEISESEILQKGVNFYIEKPFRFDDLARLVDKLLKK